MREVSNAMFIALARAGETMGVGAGELAEAAGVPEAALRSPLGRMDWDVYVRIARRLGERGGGAPGLYRGGRASIGAEWTAPLRRVAQLFVSARPMYRAGFSWFAPALFHCVRFDVETERRGPLHGTMEIAPGYQPCDELFHLTHGALVAAPQMVGLGDAAVRMELDGRRARFVIQPPASPPLLERAGRMLRAVAGARAAVDELAEQQRHLRETFLEIQRLQRDLRRLIDVLPSGILVHRAGTIVYVNPAMRACLGVDEGTHLIGRHVREFLAADEPTRGDEPWIGAGEGGRGGELRLAGAIAEAAPAQPIDFDGPALLLSMRDVSEERRAHLRLALTERMASLGTLAAGVAHEINNPLAYVMANLRGVKRVFDRLEERLPASVRVDVDAMLADAREGAERVRDIVADLGAFSLEEDESPTPVEVHAVLVRVTKLAAPQLRHRARLEWDLAAVPPVRASEGRLAQVFLHLLVNAAQAIPEGHADEHVVRVSTRAAGGVVRVAVADSGAGVPAELRARVFDPFFTTRGVGQGTGLGLAICQGIVNRLGGHIVCEPGVERGAVFTVELPAAIAPAQAPSAPQPAPARRARILIVDDEPRVVTALARVLEGHEVHMARDGRDAYQQILAGPPFDAVFCDLMMPEVSGMELYERLQAARPETAARTVFMTGGAFTPAAREFLRRIDNPVLSKPFRAESVLELVARLGERRVKAPLEARP